MSANAPRERRRQIHIAAEGTFATDPDADGSSYYYVPAEGITYEEQTEIIETAYSTGRNHPTEGEVGAQGPAFHAEVGAYARARGIDTLLALGTASADSARAFDGGRHFPTVEALLAAARDAAAGGGTLLVKGSRFMRMERVVQALAAQQGALQTMGAH